MNVGSIVKLKSGGKPMVVHIVSEHLGQNVYTCIWHNGLGEVQRDVFGEHVLVEVSA